MLNLASVSDAVSVVTSAAGSIDVFASWMDNLSGLVTPSNTLTASITTATTTTVVASPAASTQRVVRLLVIRNTHASTANDITIQVTNGTLTKTLKKETLAAGEAIWVTDGRAVTYLASGAPKEPDTLNLSGIQTLVLGAVTLAGSPTIGSIEYDGTVPYFTPVSGERGVSLSDQFITTQGGARTLANQTAAQKIFGTPTNGALTVGAGRTYRFECYFSLSAMSATSGSFGFAFLGTATFTFNAWVTEANKAALATAASAQNTVNQNSTANTTLATATTNTVGWARIRGIFRINAGGTLIPAVSLGIAAAAVVGQDSYFHCWPWGSNTVVSVGNWS